MEADDPIKPIRSENDHSNALAEIERLFDARPGAPECDRLEVLSVLVADYERRFAPLPEPDPIELLTFAMKAQGRTQTDLARLLGSRSRASEVLNRKRGLTPEMAARLSKAWSLPLELLSAPYAPNGGSKRTASRAVIAVFAFLAFASMSAGGLFWSYSRDLPGVEALAAYAPKDATRYGPDGKLAEFRKYVPLSQIPPHVVNAFLAAEDKNYYAHHGFSVPGIVRAAARNMRGASSGRRLEGAATITQQLAKTLFLAGERPSLGRKVKEIILARRLETAFSKDRILELYLNEIYMGAAAWGVGAAAECYFGKKLAEVSVAEAAYLAALAKAPNAFRLDAADNLAPARDRRDWVLARMADDGLITAAAARFARTEPLKSASLQGP
jgi:penicillin-binding protein 1A